MKPKNFSQFKTDLQTAIKIAKAGGDRFGYVKIDVLGDTKIKMTATDSFRLFQKEHELSEPFQGIKGKRTFFIDAREPNITMLYSVTAKSKRELAIAQNKKDDIRVAYLTAQAETIKEGGIFLYREAIGKTPNDYPDLSKLKPSKKMFVEVKTEELLRAVKCGQVFSEKIQMRYDKRKKFLSVRAEGEQGKTKSKLEVQKTNTQYLNFLISANYIQSVINPKDKTIRITYDGKSMPIDINGNFIMAMTAK